MKKRILSGIQPSGKLHLGNYFGAIRQHIALQDEGEAFYFIANFHALTTLNDAKQLRENTLDVAIDYLALGLAPEKATLFKQSDVPEVTELTWILNCVATFGEVGRMTQFKEKGRGRESVSVGLYVAASPKPPGRSDP